MFYLGPKNVYFDASTPEFCLIQTRIEETLDGGGFSCGIFVDLQKTFDTVDHKILLHKLEYYGIGSVCNDWLKSYLWDPKQFV